MSRLPPGWVETPLSAVVSTRSGKSKLIKGKLSAVPDDSHAIPAYSASGQDVWCAEAEYHGSGVVVSAVGARCGKAFLADGHWTAIANTHVVVPSAAVDAKFLWYRLNDERFWIRGGSAQSFVRVRPTLELAAALPPLAEQRRIVAVIEEQFSRLDACGTILKKTRARLAVLRRSVLVRAFDIASDHVPLARITDPKRPICYGILKPKTVGDLVVPYVEVRSIVAGRIDVGGLHRTTRELHEEFRRSELREGDVVLAIRGSFDRAAVVPPQLNGANVSRDVARIAPLREVDPTYLAYYLASPAAFAVFAAAARGVGVRGINIGDLRKLPVPVLPINEQRRIVVKIEQQLSLIDSLGAAVEAGQSRSAALRRAILDRAFRGELVAQDPNDEPASVLLERIRAERAAAPKPAWRKRVPA